MQYKEGVLDRFGQSLELYGKNIIKLTLPFFIYNLLVLVIAMWSIMSILATFTGGSEPTMGMAIFVIIAMLLLFLVYIIFTVPVLACTLRSIKNVANGEKADLKANFSYGMKNFWEIVKVYWFVFLYVMLIPMVIIVVGITMLALGIEAGAIVIMIGGFVQIAFMIYRGLKTAFSVYDAIDTDNYTKENFDKKLSLTDGKLLRVFGNFIVYAILVSLIMWVVGMVIGNIWTNPSITDIDFKDLKSFVAYTQSYNFFGGLIWDIIGLLFSAITTVFGFVFVYIFYKRLETEQK